MHAQLKSIASFAAACTALIFAVSASAAETITKFGIEFCEVGSPGNRAPTDAEMPWATNGRRPGSVAYSFAISKTEVNIGLWVEFVKAYEPFYKGPKHSFGILGTGMYVDPVTQEFRWNESDIRVPTMQSWRMAARFCNWLQNGKAASAAAFESGAYDTSTFFRDADGIYHDQIQRSPGATFWIPSLDEWTKAAYFDPNKNGVGQPGYWLYPGSSDVALTPGKPAEGGQTNAGAWGAPEIAGAYPSVMSPWGLLDLSGGVLEWLEGTGVGTGVEIKGTNYGQVLSEFFDRLDVSPPSFDPDDAVAGLRIATEVQISCPADLTGDHVVNDADFVLFLTDYNTACDRSGTCPADLTSDGFVDDSDFSLFAASYDVLVCG